MLRSIDYLANQIERNLVLECFYPILRQFADRRIDAPQQFDGRTVERAIVVFQAGDEFAKRLPLRFLGGVGTHALQTLGNLAQYRDGSRHIIAFQYRQQHLLIRCAYLSGFINAVNTFESLERNITGITRDAIDVVSRANGFLTQKNPQLVDKSQYGAF